QVAFRLLVHVTQEYPCSSVSVAWTKEHGTNKTGSARLNLKHQVRQCGCPRFPTPAGIGTIYNNSIT
ncbi:unnamed protein product, partial [Ectocarpus sp. 12 AP-2014]